MDADRFHDEMETAYRASIDPHSKEHPSEYFIVDSGTSYYEVDRKEYINWQSSR